MFRDNSFIEQKQSNLFTERNKAKQKQFAFL